MHIYILICDRCTQSEGTWDLGNIIAVAHALGKYMVIEDPRLMVAPLHSKEWDTSVYDS